MHETIKGFTLNGVVKESKLLQSRDTLDKECEDWMRDEGFAPVIDLNKQFSTEYNPQTEEYNFELTVYGAYVGKDKAWQVSGVMDGKMIERYTTPSK